ncbi:unnamed protein product [Closterium sp. Yama58-4]|nr:unnamed protein product [Closterium sp. Yama58-4]
MKRLEKVQHMQREMDVIEAKELGQGGLTAGQQTQIARNKTRIQQVGGEGWGGVGRRWEDALSDVSNEGLPTGAADTD